MLLLATSVVPAFAASEVGLDIRNLTQSTVQLILNGPTDLKLTITRTYTTVRVEPGTYTYRYEACGLRNTGTFRVGNSGGSLLLKKCEKDRNGVIVIQNLTGSSFLLRLNGPARYALTIKPGDNKLTLAAGRYEYIASVCKETRTGERAVKSGSKSVDWVWRCD
jgi:hypothetical protein